MTVHLVTFSDESMSRSAELCVESAKRHGVDGKDAALIYPQTSLWQTDFYRDNKALLDTPRGCGLFAWKPFVILEEMKGRSDGDIQTYSDAGVEFVDNVNYIIDRMDQDIFLFGNMYEHAHWCKRDIIEAIWPLSLDDMTAAEEDGGGDYMDWWRVKGWARFGKQVQASVIFFRVNDKTRAFVKEWLDWCLFDEGRLIDDSPSSLPNHPEFRENRHDQSILTTMAYRDGIKLSWWPAVYNDGAFIYPRGEYSDLQIPPLFHHHRKRDIDWTEGRVRSYREGYPA